MLKKSILSFVIHVCCMVSFSNAQKQIQGGLYIGGITYQGDLAPSSFILSASETHLDLGGFLYIKPKKWLGLKVNYHHGTLSGSDSSANSMGRQERNLSFRSPIDELSVSGAFFYTFNTRRQKIIQPFLTLGVGLFKFNPQAQYNGKWYDLQPLSTEGQGLKNFASRSPYKLLQVCFPLGGGIQMSLSKRLQISVDLSLRKTLTDYLDDVSTTYVSLEDLRKERGELALLLSNRSLTNIGLQNSANQTPRGDATHKDWYVIGSVGFVVNIFGKSKAQNLFAEKKDYTDCKRLAKSMR